MTTGCPFLGDFIKFHIQRAPGHGQFYVRSWCMCLRIQQAHQRYS